MVRLAFSVLCSLSQERHRQTNRPTSPSLSPPSLMSSSDTSATGSQPSTSRFSPPSTPPRNSRGRAPARYPLALAKGNDPSRVPLHRRGTSRTYERLEDLLREAGYKETRIFTPDSERREGGNAIKEASDQSRRKGVGGAVVGFFAGLVHGGVQDHQETAPSLPVVRRRESFSLPPSPLGHKNVTAAQDRPASPISGYASSSSSKAPSRARQQRQPYSHHPHPHAHHPHPHPHHRIRQYIADERVIRPQPSLPTYTEASPARAYLRHMASAPSMQRSPHTASSPDVRRRVVDLDEQPPMPATWLETVARAILGVPGAHAGGPTPAAPDTSPVVSSAAFTSHPASRSSTIRGRRPAMPLSDNTNGALRGRKPRLDTSLAPPTLLTSVQPASPGLVVMTQVVCRSAPASRSTSLARPRDVAADMGSVRGKGKPKPKAKARTTGKGRKTGGPSLSGRVEGDGWEAEMEADGEEEEEEEGEINLARLLVSPKRQQSIQSLRRHLHRPTHGLRTPASEGEWEQQRLRARLRKRRESLNAGDWLAGVREGTESPANTRKRRGLPRTWAQDGAERS
ncbi:hypothetical protein OF83DRAFT_614749 [Amylostereum chailletii]|nr:hypothetical protein OF83DRAFT_614749 [Amylostereum chailletii]